MPDNKTMSDLIKNACKRAKEETGQGWIKPAESNFQKSFLSINGKWCLKYRDCSKSEKVVYG